ncbi:hypothetical protein [Vulcaniibacterium tengchongense]|uniref:DUF4123 domain-containing protein n=1 Tax=Vulcaniibacterium tengchongense TaxID=1273429 RepID=A0A3N4UYS1_9GAMM|nr:hypothetical protein [Vulcaniibacterium tengchongense]RPE75866.1 hypothetical protein EDC50_2763 [Vulcaniibacterium tengchongense]
MLDELRERLIECIEARPGSRVLALLDPNHPVASYHELHIERIAKRPSRPVLTAVARDDLLSEPSLHPRLLTLRTPRDRGYPDEALLESTLECARQRSVSINGAYVCGWLVADAPETEVAAQLKRGMVMSDPSSRKRKVLALFEPHRLMLARHLAPASWLSRWLGVVHSWFLVDGRGQLQELKPALHDASHTSDLPGADFWLAQARVRRAREVLLTLAKAGQAIPSDCEIKADDALRAAYGQGLSEIEDVIFFAANQMLLRPGWHAHPAVAACIDAARKGDAALTDGLTALPDHVLDQLAAVSASTAPADNHRRSK